MFVVCRCFLITAFTFTFLECCKVYGNDATKLHNFCIKKGLLNTHFLKISSHTHDNKAALLSLHNNLDDVLQLAKRWRPEVSELRSSNSFFLRYQLNLQRFV